MKALVGPPTSATPVTPLEPLPATADRHGSGLSFDGGCAYTPAMARLEFATVSECGRLHPRNEDAYSPPTLAGHLFVVADGVGGGAMDMTVGYIKERKQFGTLIGSFQALQHRAAHLYSEMEVARAAVLKAQQLLDAGDAKADAAVSVAKAMTGLATTLAVQEGVQMHGGMGMTDAYDIGFYMKRARVLAEAFGDVGFHADRLAEGAGY